MTIILTVFEAAGLTVSETMLLRTPYQALRTSLLVIEAAGQRYRQETRFLYLSGLVNASKCRHYTRCQATGPTRMGMLPVWATCDVNLSHVRHSL